MILGQGEPKWMWYLGISWFQRMRLKLWLHFLPFRIICLFRGHRWSGPHPTIDLGPLHLPPDERYYRVLAYDKHCLLCATHEPVPLTPEKEFELIREAQEEDWEEWNDPETRAVLESLGE